MGVNMDLVNRIKASERQPIPNINEVGNPAVEVGELKKKITKQDERIKELEMMVIKLFNMVQRDYLNIM